MTTLDKSFTTAEVAEALGVSEWWVREQAKHDRVPHFRVGTGKQARYRFAASDVEQLRDSLRPTPTPHVRKRRKRRST